MTSSRARGVFIPWGFFLLTFAFSWLMWLPAVAGTIGLIPPLDERYSAILSLAGMFGPAIGAVTLVIAREGWPGFRGFAGRLLLVRFGLF